MNISEDNVLQFVDLDYETILDEIAITKEDLMPEWTDDSDTDFGNLILTYVAMLGDVLSWKIDYSINECIPALCKTIKAIYKHCKWIGYKPTSNKGATVTFEITINNNGKIQSLPKGFQVTMEDTVNGDYVIYELDENVDCTAPSGTEIDESYTIQCNGTQGESVSETIGYSDGMPDQEFFITFSPYIEGSLEIECYNSSTESSEIYTTNLNNSFVGTESDDTIIVLEQVDSDLIKVKFGDGYNGKIPIGESQLIAHYRIGGGAIGNRPIGVINTPVDELPENFVSIVNITEAIGGEDAQSVEEIKESIYRGEHKIVYSLMREEHFDTFLAKHDEIEKYRSCKGSTNSSLTNSYVWLFVKPFNKLIFDEDYKTTLLSEVNKLKLLTDVVEIKDCSEVKVLIDVNAKSDGLTDKEQLQNAIKYAINDYVNELRIGSDDTNKNSTLIGLYIEDLKDIIKAIDGISSRTVEITKLWTKEDVEISQKTEIIKDGEVENIILTLGQIFSIENLETDVNVTIL